LTIKYVELADEIDATRTAAGKLPVVIVWENVPGVLSSKDNAFGCFLAGLAGDDEELIPELKPTAGKSSRYWKWSKKERCHFPSWPKSGCVVGPQRTVAWRILDAQYLGLAQRRCRVFVVASARNDFDPTEVLFEFEGMRRDSPPSRETRESVTGTISSRTTSGGGFGTDFECSGGLQPVVGTLQANGKAAGSATQQDAESGMLVPLSVALRGRDGGATAELGDEVAGCLRASTGGGDKPHVLAPVIAFDTTQITSPANFSNPKLGDPCHPLAAGAHPPVIAFSSKDNGRDATIDLSPTLRSGNHDKSHANGGQPPAIAFDSRQDPVSSVQVFGSLGCSSPQAQAVAFTLEASAGRSRGAGTPIGMLTAISIAVRRLTPRECERLQGFPDDYTLIPTARGSSVKPHEMEEWIEYLRTEYPQITRIEAKQMAPDGPRYKALGNSMAVTCMAWLGRRIALALVPTNNIARIA